MGSGLCLLVAELVLRDRDGRERIAAMGLDSIGSYERRGQCDSRDARTTIERRWKGRKGFFVEWTGIDFSRGIRAVYEWERAERLRASAVEGELDRLWKLPLGERPAVEELTRMEAGAQVGPPLWYRIVGFNPWRDRDVDPEARRAGIERLLAVVRVLFAAEWGTSKVKSHNAKVEGRLAGVGLGEGYPNLRGIPGDDFEADDRENAGSECVGERAVAPSPRATEHVASDLSPRGEGFGAGGALPAGERDDGSAFYDPLVSICFYLGMAKSRLSAACLEVTGLKILEFLDEVRVMDFRERLTDVLRDEVTAWRRHLASSDEGDVDETEDFRAVAVRFLKWMRVNARGVSRQRLAWELGMPTKARLSKAVFLAEGVTLEELEVTIAETVLMQAADVAFEPPRMDNSVMREILNAPSAEKSELSEEGVEPERGEGNQGAVTGELESSLEGLETGEVA